MENLTNLNGGLIVSCQAKPASPLRRLEIMAAKARAAVVGTAVTALDWVAQGALSGLRDQK